MRGRCLLVGVLVIVLMLAACGGDEDEPTARLSSAGSADLTYPTTAPQTPDLRFEFDGTLLFVQGDQLMALNADMNVPQLIATDLTDDHIRVAPDQRRFLFGLPENGQRQSIYYADLKQREPLHLMTVWNSRWQPATWSPDGQWVGLQVRESVDLFRTDGGPSIEDIGPPGASVAWLPDGNALVMAVERDSSGSTAPYAIEIEQVSHLDTASGMLTPVELDLAAINADLVQLEPQLATAGYSPVSLPILEEIPDYVTFALAGSGNRHCATWQLATLGIGATLPLYHAPNAYRLDSIRVLYDGSVLFLEWRMPGCEVGTPSVNLMRLIHGEQPEVLAEKLFGGIGFSQITPDRDNRVPTYTVAGDNRHIFWVSGGLDQEKTLLNELDLESGAATVVYHQPVENRSSTTIFPFITSVYWLDS